MRVDKTITNCLISTGAGNDAKAINNEVSRFNFLKYTKKWVVILILI